MKAILPLLLCCLLLAGCGTGRSSETAAADEPQETGSLYAAGHRLESDTLGAVKAFPLPQSPGWHFFPVGAELLLVQEGSSVAGASMFTGDTLEPVSPSSREFPLDFGLSVIHTDASGFFWYDEENRSVVYTDRMLRDTQRVPLPDAPCAVPCLSADGNRLYYSTKHSICEMDLSTGISRVLKQTNAAYSMVTLLAEDSVLYCQYPDYGQAESVFLSVADGATLRSTDDFPIVCSSGDTFFALHCLQQHQEILIQKPGKALSVLIPGQDRSFLQFDPENNQILTFRPDSAGSRITLDVFNADSGRRTATLRLPNVTVPTQAETDAAGNIWLLTYDEIAGQDVLLRWNPSESTLQDARSYLSAHYTAEAPDWDGLHRCAEKAEEISRRHGIQVRIYEDATTVQPWDYTFTAEYLVPQLEWELEKLDGLLDAYPEGFLETLGSNFDTLSICLVRSITGTASSGTLDTADGLQFWEQKNGYIALVVGTATQYNLYHELSHMIDTHVINHCRGYDNWEALNPEGFTYDYDYIQNLSRDGNQYLGETDRAFVDTYAMSFPTEDRARIMEYAMNENNEYLFQSPIMQAKLKQLCLAIRDAFGLTKNEASFRWEQYLEYSLAYREWKK